VKAKSSGEDPRVTGALVSNLPHPRVDKTKQHTQSLKQIPLPGLGSCAISRLSWPNGSTGPTILQKLLWVGETLCWVRYGSSLETHTIIQPVKGTGLEHRHEGLAVHQSPLKP